ncbi:MAG: hypothetical protein VX278_18620 [Myxococcota bacterium]|nr:hypothetical protein [Myxococcota bacterium]
MNVRPVLTIIGLGALTGFTGCAKQKGEPSKLDDANIEAQPQEETNDGETKEAVDTTNKPVKEEPNPNSAFSEECVADYELDATCAPHGMKCPPPKSMKGGICPPPSYVECIKGEWTPGPMPTCNPPPPLPPPPTE